MVNWRNSLAIMEKFQISPRRPGVAARGGAQGTAAGAPGRLRTRGHRVRERSGEGEREQREENRGERERERRRLLAFARERARRAGLGGWVLVGRPVRL